MPPLPVSDLCAPCPSLWTELLNVPCRFATSPPAGLSSTACELAGVTRCPRDDAHSPAGVRRSHHRPSLAMGASAGWEGPMASEERPGRPWTSGGGQARALQWVEPRLLPQQGLRLLTWQSSRWIPRSSLSPPNLSKPKRGS